MGMVLRVQSPARVVLEQGIEELACDHALAIGIARTVAGLRIVSLEIGHGRLDRGPLCIEDPLVAAQLRQQAG